MHDGLYLLAILMGLALLSVPAWGASASVTVTNAPPTITAASNFQMYRSSSSQEFSSKSQWDTWSSGQTLVSNIQPQSGSAVYIQLGFTVTDLDGYLDVATVNVKVLKPGGSVHIADAAATRLAGSGTSATYWKQVTMQFYDEPATGASFYSVVVTATDSAGNSASNVVDPKLFNYDELTSASLPASVDLGGSVARGATSSGQLTVTNLGNVAIDLQISASDLTSGSNTIPVSVITYGPTSDGGAFTLSGTTQTDAGFTLARGAASSRAPYVAVTVPSDAAAGTYTGTITLGAIKDGTCASNCNNVAWS
jgi:hypothetical protein